MIRDKADAGVLSLYCLTGDCRECKRVVSTLPRWDGRCLDCAFRAWGGIPDHWTAGTKGVRS